MNLDLDDTYFKIARPKQLHDQQTLSKCGCRPTQTSHEAPPCHHFRRSPIRHVRLTGFFCQPGDEEYAAAAKATGTKGNLPIYWFKGYRYENELYDDADRVHEIHTISQAERDAILYPYTMTRQPKTPTKTKTGDAPVTSSLRK